MDLIQLSSDPQVLQSTSIKIVTKPTADGAANITSGQIEPGLSDNTGLGRRLTRRSLLERNKNWSPRQRTFKNICRYKLPQLAEGIRQGQDTNGVFYTATTAHKTKTVGTHIFLVLMPFDR